MKHRDVCFCTSQESRENQTMEIKVIVVIHKTILPECFIYTLGTNLQFIFQSNVTMLEILKSISGF